MKIVEGFGLPDAFALGIGRIEVLDGGFARLIFYTDRLSDSEAAYQVAAKVVIPIGAVPDAVLQLTKATAISVMGTGEPVYN